MKTCLFMLLILFGPGALAQSQKVSGKVTDESGEILLGVSITIQGTTTGTTTDLDGIFSLMADTDDILSISYVGYVTQQFPVNNQTYFNIKMVEDLQSLEEVVVVGYGTQKKSDIISSVASVDEQALLKVPSTDIGEMLRGKVAGVYVTTASAAPGGSTNILIRGKSSINGGTSPIYIADGVQIGGLNDINPNDIESMEILKDAAAQAIYGARAANGVVLITTKRGKVGQTRVTYNGYYGVQSVNRWFDIYSAEEFAQLKREAFRTDNLDDSYENDVDIFTPTEYDVIQNGNYIDWEKEVLQTASIQSHNASISTGTENTTVYAGLNYNQQGGVIPGTDFRRFNIRFNADQKINNWLKVGINSSWQLSDKNIPGTGSTLQRTITTSPLGVIYNDDGSFKTFPTDQQESRNPLMDISTTSNLEEDRNDIMNLFFDVTPFKGFKYRINLSRRSWHRKTQNYSTSESLTGVVNGGVGSGYLRYQDNYELMLENIFTYDFDFGDTQHGLNLTAVQSAIESKYNDFRNSSSQIPNDLLGISGLEAAGINTPTIGGNERQLLSVMGRIQYDYDGKYYVNGAFRADGSSVFGKNNKWATFPSVAVGWNIFREDFMDGISVVNNLKLRASYGSVGNQAIDPYESQALADQRDYLFNGVKRVGYVAGTDLPNPNLKWETSTTLNVALDFGLWTDRISGTVEYFDKRTTDLLVWRNISALGYNRTLDNIGEVKNAGIELSLNTILVDQEDFQVSVGFTGARIRNSIVSLFGEDEDGDGIEDDDVANSWFIGQPIDVHYRYQPIGIFQIGEDIASTHQPNAVPGQVKLFDRYEDDGELNADDRVITQEGPDWFGSFQTDISYKGFDLSASVYVVQGVVRNNPFLYGYNEGGSLRGIYSGVKQDYWLPENPTGNWPRPRESNDQDFIWTLGLQDASFIRLQNVTLGYNLPQAVLDKAGLNKLRVFVTGQNLITITEYQSFSPERNPNEYPEARTITAGLQLGF
ncbi:MAG: TonB-dependent receptor [Cyclobacteriaceae bacterium]